MYTLLITSGRRPQLFRRTINSFKTYCLDHHLISEWICIDDGTDETTRKELALEYPKIKFINKTPDQVGHALSLNIATPLLTTKYTIRLEDDWEFIGPEPAPLITQAVKILDEFPMAGQVMFNANYQETANVKLLGGRLAHTADGMEFMWHDYASGDDAMKLWHQRHGYWQSVLQCWPHFSLQPSVTRTEVFKTLGYFNESSSYFEYQYGQSYMKKGWQTAFLNQVSCIHIGRIINDRNGPLNAYELLGQEQFGHAPRAVPSTITETDYTQIPRT